MGTIFSTTSALATAYGNQRKIDRAQNGVLWALRNSQSSDGQLLLAYSTDNGATWTVSSPINTGGASTTYQTNASLFIDVDDYAHVAFKQDQNGYLYYVRGTPNAARTAYSWSATVQVPGGSTSRDYPDIVAFRDPANAGAWVAWVVYSITGSVVTKTGAVSFAIAANGAVTAGGTSDIAAALAAANSNPGYASIDFNHVGDGKTVAGGTPHLYVGWSAGATGSGYGIRFRKATYASGAWTWGTEREIDTTGFVSTAEFLNCLFDGTRVLLVGKISGANDQIIAHERDAADTTTTLRVLATNPASAQALNYGSASYDVATGNVYLFGTDGTSKLNYRRWVRTTQTFEPAVNIAAATTKYASARRGGAGAALDFVWTSGSASPYTVNSGRIVLNRNPTAPTPSAPLDNAAWDSEQPNAVVFVHNDPDGDAASAYRLSWRPAGTSVPYQQINGSTSAANGGTVTVPIPAGTWVGVIEYYSQTFDTAGAISAPSPTRTVTALPATLTAATGGQGGASLEALDLYTMAQSERTLRALSLV